MFIASNPVIKRNMFALGQVWYSWVIFYETTVICFNTLFNLQLPMTFDWRTRKQEFHKQKYRKIGLVFLFNFKITHPPHRKHIYHMHLYVSLLLSLFFCVFVAASWQRTVFFVAASHSKLESCLDLDDSFWPKDWFLEYCLDLGDSLWTKDWFLLSIFSDDLFYCQLTLFQQFMWLSWVRLV